MTQAPLSYRIGFVGTGRMATALAAGFIRQNLVPADHITGYDIAPGAQEAFAKTTGAGIAADLDKLVQNCTLLFLAVKPQHLIETAAEIVGAELKSSQTVISIAAGVSLDSLCSALNGHRQCIRVMPNTPALVCEGASAMVARPDCPAEHVQAVMTLLGSVGCCETVPEKLMDAVTGLSGSGPAYVFQMIEAMSDGGVAAGLPRATATRLAAQTVLGAAKMVLETGEHPGALKDAVASPGGTTIAGLAALERNAFRGTLIDAILAATKRSQELGKK
ncbi:MAG: pyrroline-5-carboxylate reductase [Planctomycetaceae bacterium]|nr:pyrroline-5-carboxylate reductase [Planctomycetaceae bacterium]